MVVDAVPDYGLGTVYCLRQVYSCCFRKQSRGETRIGPNNSFTPYVDWHDQLRLMHLWHVLAGVAAAFDTEELCWP